MCCRYAEHVSIHLESTHQEIRYSVSRHRRQSSPGHRHWRGIVSCLPMMLLLLSLLSLSLSAFPRCSQSCLLISLPASLTLQRSLNPSLIPLEVPLSLSLFISLQLLPPLPLPTLTHGVSSASATGSALPALCPCPAANFRSSLRASTPARLDRERGFVSLAHSLTLSLSLSHYTHSILNPSLNSTQLTSTQLNRPSKTACESAPIPLSPSTALP